MSTALVVSRGENISPKFLRSFSRTFLFSRLIAIDVPDRELRHDLVETVPVRELNSDAGSQALLPPIQIVPRHLRVFTNDNLLPQGRQSRTGRPRATVLEIPRFGRAALEQRQRDDVLHAVVAIGGIGQYYGKGT